MLLLVFLAPQPCPQHVRSMSATCCGHAAACPLRSAPYARDRRGAGRDPGHGGPGTNGGRLCPGDDRAWRPLPLLDARSLRSWPRLTKAGSRTDWCHDPDRLALTSGTGPHYYSVAGAMMALAGSLGWAGCGPREISGSGRRQRRRVADRAGAAARLGLPARLAHRCSACAYSDPGRSTERVLRGRTRPLGRPVGGGCHEILRGRKEVQRKWVERKGSAGRAVEMASATGPAAGPQDRHTWRQCGSPYGILVCTAGVCSAVVVAGASAVWARRIKEQQMQNHGEFRTHGHKSRCLTDLKVCSASMTVSLLMFHRIFTE